MADDGGITVVRPSTFLLRLPVGSNQTGRGLAIVSANDLSHREDKL